MTVVSSVVAATHPNTALWIRSSYISYFGFISKSISGISVFAYVRLLFLCFHLLHFLLAMVLPSFIVTGMHHIMSPRKKIVNIIYLIVSFNVSYHILYRIIYRIILSCILLYDVSYHIIYRIVSSIVLYHKSYHISHYITYNIKYPMK